MESQESRHGRARGGAAVPARLREEGRGHVQLAAAHARVAERAPLAKRRPAEQACCARAAVACLHEPGPLPVRHKRVRHSLQPRARMKPGLHTPVRHKRFGHTLQPRATHITRFPYTSGSHTRLCVRTAPAVLTAGAQPPPRPSMHARHGLSGDGGTGSGQHTWRKGPRRGWASYPIHATGVIGFCARGVKDLGAVGLPAGAAGGEQEVVPGRLEHGRRLAAQPHQRARILCLARARPASLRSPGTATDAARARGSGAQEQLCRNRCCQAQHRQGCIAIPPSPQHRRAKAGVRLLVIWGGAWRYWSKV